MHRPKAKAQGRSERGHWSYAEASSCPMSLSAQAGRSRCRGYPSMSRRVKHVGVTMPAPWSRTFSPATKGARLVPLRTSAPASVVASARARPLFPPSTPTIVPTSAQASATTATVPAPLRGAAPVRVASTPDLDPPKGQFREPGHHAAGKMNPPARVKTDACTPSPNTAKRGGPARVSTARTV